MSYTKKALKGFTIVFIVNIIAAFLGYLIRIVLARNLTIAEYGLFFAVFTLINFIGIFSHFGMGDALVKYISHFLVKKKYNKINESVVIALGFQVVAIIILAILLLGLSGLLAEHYFKSSIALPLILLFLVVRFFSNLKGLLRSIYQAFQRMTTYALVYLVENSFILIFLLLFFLIKKDIFLAVYAYIAAYLLILLIFLPLLFRVFHFFRYKLSVTKDLFKKLFKFGIPVMLISVGGIIILYTDTLILTYFRSLKEVGIYNVIVPTVMMIMFFVKSISSVVFPMASELWARKKRKYLEHGLTMLEKYSFVIVIPVAFVILAFPGTILSLFFGSQYAQGALTMQILVIGILFLVIYGINSTLFTSIGKPWISTKILLQGAIINFLLNLLFIPKLGMLGAAITSLITYFYVFVVSVFKLRNFIKVRIPWINWSKTFISGMIMLGVMFMLKKILFINVYLEIIIICIIGGVIYVSLILLMKIIYIKEVKGLVRTII